LKRIGHFDVVPLQPIVPSPQSYAYRNRITVHCEDGAIGFYRRAEHRLIDVEFCPISTPPVNQQLKALRDSRPRDGHYTLRAHSEARIFSQVNDGVAELLLQHVRDLIPERNDLLIDAFCGAGFFAKSLLNKFQRAIGIDWDKFAIEIARRTATENETYVAGDVDFELKNLGARLASTLIVDPPSTGLTNAGCQAITALAPHILIYVSCNPATLARDLKELNPRFAIDSVTPFDMFPQTAEIEVAVKLSLRPS
jgi:tRNA/tmRNA/rRNA uracil-C5-methylase (TrmA/RlmC/RlmD family)